MAALAVVGNLDEARIDGWAGQRITTVVGMSEGFTSSMVRLSVTVMAPEASSVVWLMALDTLAVGTWARRCWRTDRAAPTDGPSPVAQISHDVETEKRSLLVRYLVKSALILVGDTGFEPVHRLICVSGSH